jgi:hypothetical protein
LTKGTARSKAREEHTNRDVAQLVKLVHQRPDHRHVNLEIPQLLQRQIVLDDAHNVAPDAMDVRVHGQVAVRVRAAAEDVLAIGGPFRRQPAEQRAALVGRILGDADPSASVCHVRVGGRKRRRERIGGRG